jgi:hypothetical protein
MLIGLPWAADRLHSLQQPRGFVQGQAHYARIAAGDMFDEHRAPALDGIGAGLARRLARIPVRTGLRCIDRTHAYGGDRQRFAHVAAGNRHGNGGHHLVLASPECGQHADGIVAAAGLAEHRALEDDDGVGAEHGPPAAVLLKPRQRLGARQAHRERIGRLARRARLIHVGRHDFVFDAQLFEQRAAPRRGRGEHDAWKALGHLVTCSHSR